MTAHALLSPSSAHRWMRCPGSVVLEARYPSTSSAYADEGTKAHEIAAAILLQRPVGDVDSEMLEYVERYTDAVKAAAMGGVIAVEQRVDLSDALGTADMFGTVDAVVIPGNGELQIHDLKYGRGVQVDAEENEQLLLYAVGAWRAYDYLGPFHTLRTVIHQPRLDHVSEAVRPIVTLDGWARSASYLARKALEQTVENPLLSPGEKQCRFCKAKASCRALRDKIEDETRLSFEDLDAPPAQAEVLPALDAESLAQSFAAVALVETWCKAVRAEAFKRLAEGSDLPGFKLVEGKRGNRRWGDEAEAEAVLKSMRLKTEQMYDLSLISPTSAEKLAKAGAIGPRQWPKLQALITQSAGKPSVAPASDKRPAISVAAQATDFDDLTEGD